jgi:hypothetical protein
MATGTITFFNAFKKLLLDADVDLAADTIKCALLTSSYTPDLDAHDNFDDVSTYESSGTGYTAGGATLSGKSVTQDNVNNKGVFDADDVQWASSTIPDARYAVLYKSTGTPSTSKLICLITFDGTLSTSSSNFDINWNANGIFQVS